MTEASVSPPMERLVRVSFHLLVSHDQRFALEANILEIDLKTDDRVGAKALCLISYFL